MPAGNDRIPQDVTDISSVGQLIRFAAAGQLEHLLGNPRAITQGKIALGARFGKTTRAAGANLSAALRNGLDTQHQHLQDLDEIIGALAPDLNGTGGLRSLALRLSPERRNTINARNLTAHVPASWTKDVLKEPAANEIGVLIQASALLSAFVSAHHVDTAGTSILSIGDRYRGQVDQLVRRLVLISVAPPTSRGYDAQIMLGSLASYSFKTMRVELESALKWSPLGFRVWRAITKLVKLSEPGEHADALRAWVRRLLMESDELRKDSLYAGRSLDLELAITVPAEWSPPGADWVGETLRVRAQNSEATIRERGMAAMGLWQRAITEDRPGLDRTEAALRKLIEEFRDPATRPDAAAGLRWVAATLEHVINTRVPVCNDWPVIDEPWYDHVQEAAEGLDNYGISPHLLTGTKNLFRHMILQNAGVYRRQAIETVVASGMSEPIARALSLLLRTEENEPWLRIRAEFALGMLQLPDPYVEGDLVRACQRAYERLNLQELPTDQHPPRSHVTELHSSLFAFGDCFGVEGAGERTRIARDKLRTLLTSLAEMGRPRALILRRAARAAAYVLTMTAQPRSGSEADLSEALLEKMRDHPDPVTARLSDWALRFRFAPDGTIRPLLAAADLEDYGPYS